MDNSIQQLPIDTIHQQNQILWLSLVGGVVMITATLIYISNGAPEFYNQDHFFNSMFMYIASVLTMVTAIASGPLIKKRIITADVKGLKNKFVDFRSNFVLNAALHEGPALISTVFMMLDNNIYFLFFVLINLALLYMARPTIQKFKSWYQLSSAENQELRGLNL